LEVTDGEIKTIETAVENLPRADDPAVTDLRHRALKRVGKALERVRDAIKEFGSDIYDQLHPSPELPKLEGDFDECAERVRLYLDECLSGLEKNEEGTEEKGKSSTKQNFSTARKFGKAMQKIVVHIIPVVKFLVKLGKEDGLVIAFVLETIEPE
jgi:hypothetical protein